MKRIFLLMVFLLMFIDQFIKDIILKYLSDEIVIIPNILELVMVRNRGAAFGILQNRRWFFIIFTVLAIFYFFYIIFIKEINSKLFIISSMLITGGGVGNLLDRIFRGFVIDYIKLSFFPPVFNFSDVCITVGGILLVVYVYLSDVKKGIEK